METDMASITDFENIGQELADFFTRGFPAQMSDKIQNATTGIAVAFRVYGDLRQQLGAAIQANEVGTATVITEQAKTFLGDTLRFFASSSGVDDFRHNSYIWAKKWATPEEATSMGVTDGTPDDYQ